MKGMASICLASLLGVTCCGLSTGQEKKVKMGEAAPAFQSVDDQGKPYKSKDVVGKKVVVLFFFPAALTGG